MPSCSKNLEGIVKDNFNNPVKHVLVKIENSNFKTLTDEDGKYIVWTMLLVHLIFISLKKTSFQQL